MKKQGAKRNKRSVWHLATKSYPEAHFAVFPPELAQPCIRAGSAEGDIVLDPFAGSGTTLKVARDLRRYAVGVDLNYEYCQLQQKRFKQRSLF